MTLIRCDWPDSALSPNSRSHYMQKHRASAKYRHACETIAREQRVHKQIWPDGEIKVHLTFHPPTNAKRDDDNLEASFKSGRDGIADAMGVDDNRFKVTRSIGDKTKGGCVMVKIVTESIQSIQHLGGVS